MSSPAVMAGPTTIRAPGLLVLPPALTVTTAVSPCGAVGSIVRITRWPSPMTVSHGLSFCHFRRAYPCDSEMLTRSLAGPVHSRASSVKVVGLGSGPTTATDGTISMAVTGGPPEGQPVATEMRVAAAASPEPDLSPERITPRGAGTWVAGADRSTPADSIVSWDPARWGSLPPIGKALSPP